MVTKKQQKIRDKQFKQLQYQLKWPTDAKEAEQRPADPAGAEENKKLKKPIMYLEEGYDYETTSQV
jgi:hypothetical protein